MKNKFFSFILTFCLILPCAFIMSACGSKPPEDPVDANVYVTKPTIANAEIKVVSDYYSTAENVAEDGRVYVPKSNDFYVKVCLNEGYNKGNLVIMLNGTELEMIDESAFLISQVLNSNNFNELVITASGNVSLQTYNVSVNFIDADAEYIHNLQSETELTEEEVRVALYNKYKFKFNAKFRDLLDIDEDRYYTGNELKSILASGKNIEVTHGDVLEILYACNDDSVYAQYIESPIVNSNIQSVQYTEHGVLSTILINEQNMSSLENIDIAVFNTNSDFYTTAEPGAYFFNKNTSDKIYISSFSTPFITCKLNNGESNAIPYAAANEEGNKAYLTLAHYAELKTYYDEIEIVVNGVNYVNKSTNPYETDCYFIISEDGVVEINLMPLWKYGTADGSNDNMKFWNIEINDVVSEMIEDGELVKVNFADCVITRSENQGQVEFLQLNGVLLIENEIAFYCRYKEDSKEDPLLYECNLNSVYFYKNDSGKYKFRISIEDEGQEFQIFKVSEGTIIPQFIANINSTTDTEQIKVEVTERDDGIKGTYYDIEIDISLLNEGEYIMFGEGFDGLTEE